MVSKGLSHAKSSRMINGIAPRTGQKRKSKLRICGRKRLHAARQRAVWNSIDAEIQREFQTMHKFVSQRDEEIVRDFILHFEACLFGVRVRKLTLHVAQWELKQRARAWVSAGVGKGGECLTGEERPVNTHDSGGSQTCQAGARIGKTWKDRLVHVGERRGALPRHQDVAVVEWAGE